jgi:hypothetical protein
VVVLPKLHNYLYGKIAQMKKFKSTGLSLPQEFLEKIDSERGDIPRSRYLLRLIVKAYGEVYNGEK